MIKQSTNAPATIARQLVSLHRRKTLALTLQRIHNELYQIASELEMDANLEPFAHRAREAQVLSRDAGYLLSAVVENQIHHPEYVYRG